MLFNNIFDTFCRQVSAAPTKGQTSAMQLLADFVESQSEEHPLFILKGYAGTGKTSLISSLVKTLGALHKNTVLLAPTGRAAKVFSVYANRKAYTIHKYLYRVQSKNGFLRFVRKPNKTPNTIFIVDEVSMISDSPSEGLADARSLLDDLISFVFEQKNCKLLFIGDDAQLPPVNCVESPALDYEYMQRNFNVNITTHQLKEVVRQALNSGILNNANALRSKLTDDDFSLPLFNLENSIDVRRINGNELTDEYATLYSELSPEAIVTITRSNKRAYLFNQEIRNRIFYHENEISTGDFIMAVKNNYYWLDETSEAGFIANGDIMEIMSINKTQELYGFRFADITARLCDYRDYPTVDIKIILESLQSEGPSMSGEQNNALYQAVAEDYADIADKRKRYMAIKNDPFLNAVQIKFSYALTCHKTQGGQWKVIFIDQGFIPETGLDKEYLRWLYTALTRATRKVYLINFKDEMFV
ncbi:MAG: AAA family ATPase [Bacteroidales bacterium]|nr:AAA family ATPase [Bacteroidales bacterium]